jgi:hypothetical protein
VSKENERQQLIGFRVGPELLDEIDRKRGRLSRSEFLRQAVFAELKDLGSDLNEEATTAPDRKGKGGRPRKRIQTPEKAQINRTGKHTQRKTEL